MIATVLTLLLMAMVVRIFAMVGDATAQTRSMLETNERLRNCKITLQADLANATARMLPPLRVEEQAGYFEYVEGPMGPVPAPPTGPALPIPNIQPVDSELGVPDTTVGDIDAVLMLTTRNQSQPFYGRFRAMVNLRTPTTTGFQFVDTVATSQYAEVCYFVRGSTLYRRVLLVLGKSPTVNMTLDPHVNLIGQIDPAALSSTYDGGASYPFPPTSPPTPLPPPPFPYLYDHSFYDKYDVSARQVGGSYDKSAGANPAPFLMANSLGDLTRRENRYGHQPHAYPYDTRFWGALGLPTLRECTFYTNIFGAPLARWPFPFYEPSPSLLTMNIAPAEATNLWAFPSATPQAWNLPYIYPYPSALPVYQNYYQNATMPDLNYYNANLLPAGATPSTVPPAPGGALQYLYLTQNGVWNAGKQDSWLSFPRLPLPPVYPWDQVSPFNGSIAAFSLSPDERDPLPPNPPAPPSQYDASTRVSDDVILTNVISFDVKAWDPQAPVVYGTIAAGPYAHPTPTPYLPGDGGWSNAAGVRGTGGSYMAAFAAVGRSPTQNKIASRGAYVDLNYQQQIGNAYPSIFSGPYYPARVLKPTDPDLGLQAVYDTGCFSYEEDGVDQDGVYGPDQFTNGLDDNGIGGVDDYTEMEGPVSYAAPLKGIQVKIRVFEPDSRQIREITVVEDFLWE